MKEEFESSPHYELTYDSPEFDPKDPTYARQEDSLVDSSGHLREIGDRGQNARCICSISRSLSEARQVAELLLQSNAVPNEISNVLMIILSCKSYKQG